MRLRPPARGDAEALVRFFEGLSDQSLYLRFHGHPSVDVQLVTPDLEPDWVERGALLGAVASDEGERVVTLASYVRLRDREVAEVAFAVADGHQRRGIGTRLLEQLAVRRRAGNHTFRRRGDRGEPADAAGLLGGWVQHLPEASAGVVEVTFPIATTPATWRGSPSATTPRWRPRCGRSSSRGRWPSSARPPGEARSAASSSATSSLRTSTASATSINRNGESVAGVRGYRSIDDVTAEVDLAVLAFPRARCSRRPSRRSGTACAR